MNIAPIDWIIIAAGFCFFLGWAIYLNSKCKSVADYLVSGRKVRMWLGMSAGIAGEIGLLAIVSMCEQGFGHGYSFVAINFLSMCITIPLFGVFGFGIQRFRATKAMSVPQYLEMRFSRRVRILTGMFNCLAGVIQMCVFAIAGASFVRVLIRAPQFVALSGHTIPTDWIIMTILLLCPLIFTYLGGYTTLIVTDFFQAIIIMTAMTVLLFLIVHKLGVQGYWSGLESARGLAGVHPFADSPGSYGVQWFIWLNVMTILLQFSYGPYLQKYAAMDKPKTVSRSYLLGQLVGGGKALIVFGIGVGAVAAMGSRPPAGLNVDQTTWQNMATPYYLSSMVPPVLMGFLLLGLLFANVAVSATYMLSWATSIVNDCIYPFRTRAFEPAEQIRAVRLTILILTVLFFFFGLTYKPTMPLWDYMWLLSTIIGGSGIVVLLGMYWRRASTAGAYAALAICWTLPLFDVIARQIFARTHPDATFPILPRTTGLYTYVLGAVMMILVSLFSRQPSRYWDLGQAVREQNRDVEEPNSPSEEAVPLAKAGR
jgi:SSS family solute:Na+ symporter